MKRESKVRSTARGLGLAGSCAIAAALAGSLFSYVEWTISPTQTVCISRGAIQFNSMGAAFPGGPLKHGLRVGTGGSDLLLWPLVESSPYARRVAVPLWIPLIVMASA